VSSRSPAGWAGAESRSLSPARCAAWESRGALGSGHALAFTLPARSPNRTRGEGSVAAGADDSGDGRTGTLPTAQGSRRSWTGSSASLRETNLVPRGDSNPTGCHTRPQTGESASSATRRVRGEDQRYSERTGTIRRDALAQSAGRAPSRIPSPRGCKSATVTKDGEAG